MRHNQERFNRHSRYRLVSPSGMETPVRIVDRVRLGPKKGLLIVIDRVVRAKPDAEPEVDNA